MTAASPPPGWLRGRWVPVAVALLLATTQFFVMVPNPVSVGGAKKLNVAELPLLAVLLATGVWIVLRGGWARLSRLGRWLAVATPVAAAVWAAMVVLRRAVHAPGAIAVTVVEYLLCGVAVYLFAELARWTREQISLGVLGFLAGANLWAVALVVLHEETVRRMGLLGNINYYVGVVLMSVPMLAIVAIRSRSRVLRWATLVTVGSSLALVLLSGSRFGGSATLLMLVLLVAVVDPRPWRKRLVSVAVGVAVCGALFGGLALANDEQLKDARRTFNVLSVVKGEEPDTEDLVEEYRNNPDQPPRVPNEHDVATTPGDPDHDPLPPADQPNILNHTRVLHRSLAVLDDHWLLGIGRIGPYFSGWGYQPAHNIVMELALYVGVIGVPFWFAVLLAGVPAALRVGDRWAWLLGFSGLFGFAMFQPLLTDAIVTILPMWLLLAAARARREPGRIGVRAQG